MNVGFNPFIPVLLISHIDQVYEKKHLKTIFNKSVYDFIGFFSILIYIIFRRQWVLFLFV